MTQRYTNPLLLHRAFSKSEVSETVQFSLSQEISVSKKKIDLWSSPSLQLQEVPVVIKPVGTIIYNFGQILPVDILYIIEKGKVAVQSASGTKLLSLRARNAFPITSFIGSSPPDATYIVTKQVTLRQVSYRHVVKLIQKDHLTAISLCEELSGQARRFFVTFNQLITQQIASHITPKLPFALVGPEAHALLLSEARIGQGQASILSEANTNSFAMSLAFTKDLSLLYPCTITIAPASPFSISLEIHIFDTQFTFEFSSELKKLTLLSDHSGEEMIKLELEYANPDPQFSSKPYVCCLYFKTHAKQHSTVTSRAVYFMVLHQLDVLGESSSLCEIDQEKYIIIFNNPRQLPVQNSWIFQPTWLPFSILLRKACRVVFAPGQKLIDPEANELTDHRKMLDIITGIVSVESLATKECPSLPIAFIAAPGCVGEMSFASRSPPNAIVRAYTAVEALQISSRDLHCLYNKPHLKTLIAGLLCKIRAHRIVLFNFDSTLSMLKTEFAAKRTYTNLESFSLPLSRSETEPFLSDGSSPKSKYHIRKKRMKTLRTNSIPQSSSSSRFITLSLGENEPLQFEPLSPQQDCHYPHHILSLLWRDPQANQFIFHIHRYIFWKESQADGILSDLLVVDWFRELSNTPLFSIDDILRLHEVLQLWIHVGIQHQNLLNSTQYIQVIDALCSLTTDIVKLPAIAINPNKVKEENQALMGRLLSLKDIAERANPSSFSSIPRLSISIEYDVDDFTAQDLAQLLSFIEWEIFARLPLSELLSGRFSKPDTSPVLRQLVSHFNFITQIVSSSILSRTTMQSRIMLIDLWISVADQAFKMNNFSLGLQVTSALGSTSISRLKSSWLGIQPKQMKLFNDLSSLFNPLDNYTSYRKALTKISKPALPVMPVFQKDLTFLEDTIRQQFEQAVPSSLDYSLPVPWAQVQAVGHIIAHVADLQRSIGYPSHPCVAIFKQTLTHYSIFDESAQYEISLRYDSLRNQTASSISVMDSQLAPFNFSTHTIRLLFPKEIKREVQKLLGLGSVLLKTINVPNGKTVAYLRCLLIEKLFIHAPKCDDIFMLRQELDSYGLFSSQWKLSDGEIIEPTIGELQFKPTNFKRLPVTPVQQQIFVLSSQLEETKTSFNQEIFCRTISTFSNSIEF